MHKLRILPCLLVLVVAVTNCKEEEAPVIVAPPPPTPREIADEIMAQLGLDAPIPRAGIKLPPGTAQTFLNQVRQQMSRHSTTPDGKEALKMVSRQVDQRIRATEEIEAWDFVVVLTEVHVILNPGSQKFVRLREDAEIQLRKPVVDVLLLWQKDGKWTARLKFSLPLTGEEYTKSLRLDEDFEGIKLRDFVANGRGVELEYLETGEIFLVMALN